MLSYVHDLIRYAAKSSKIDVSAILTEEVKEERIKQDYDAQIMTYRVNTIVSMKFALLTLSLA